MKQSDDPARYVLWLVPPAPMADRYAGLIAELCDRYAAPKFPPHVTLLGRLLGSRAEVEAGTAQLAAETDPFLLRLARVECGTEYYRCVYVRAAPSAALDEIRRRACALLPHQPGPAYLPHLSLLYGDLPADERLRAADTVRLRCAGEFEVRSVFLYDCSGAPEQWQCLREFPFRHQNSSPRPMR